MSTFAELACVAVALYLWECTLWLPLRGITLRRRFRGNTWKALDPRGLFTGKELGLVPMWLLPPDAGLAPCQAPPLMVVPGEGFLIEGSDGQLALVKTLAWEDLVEEDHHLVVNGVRTRLASRRCVGVLRRAKQRGATVEEAILQAWRLSLSPGRSSREWKRWKIASSGMLLYCPLLALVVLVGLPLAYLYLGVMQVLVLVAWAWLLMLFIASRLWWLSRRVYPDSKSALRLDAWLAMLVPFHAMRAMEIASVHAMGATHPAGLILATRDLENPWLARFARRLLHPKPGNPEDAAFSSALRPLLDANLRMSGGSISNYDHPPAREEDPETTCYCPRCHGKFMPGTSSCGDCGGIPLLDFN